MRASLKDLLEADEHIIRQARTHWLWNLRGLGLPNLFSTFLITDRRILQQTGIFALRTRSLALSQIESREVTQTILGRILGYGDIHLRGSGGVEFALIHIDQLMLVASAIGKATATPASKGTGTSANRNGHAAAGTDR